MAIMSQLVELTWILLFHSIILRQVTWKICPEQ